MKPKTTTAPRGFVVLFHGKPMSYGNPQEPCGRILHRGGVFLFRRRSTAALAIKRTAEMQKRISAAFPKWKYAAPKLADAEKFSIVPQFEIGG